MKQATKTNNNLICNSLIWQVLPRVVTLRISISQWKWAVLPKRGDSFTFFQQTDSWEMTGSGMKSQFLLIGAGRPQIKGTETLIF